MIKNLNINFKKFDYVKAILILITVFILFQALPVHFFADKAEYLFLGKYFNNKPLEIFSPFRTSETNDNPHLLHYRPMERIFWTICYRLSGMDPIAGNIIVSILFLALIISLYNIIMLLSKDRFSAFISAIFFLIIPANYKLIHWLGNPTLIYASFTSLALFFLFDAFINNNRNSFLMGLISMSAAFLTTAMAIFFIPVMFSIFFLLYCKSLPEMKKLFFFTIFYALIIGSLILILEQVAWKDASKINIAAFKIHEVNIRNIPPNIIAYYKILTGNIPIYFFIISLILFLFKPAKLSFLALSWFIFSVVFYLPLYSVSSRYFTQATIGLSMFLIVVLTQFIKEKFKQRNFILVILFFISLYCFSISRINTNIARIRHSFELAKYSYSNQKQDMQRLYSLPNNAVMYVDNLAPKIFYSWILRTINRNDIKIEITDSKDMPVGLDFFFEGETLLVQGKNVNYIIDKTGDWRF